MGVIGYRVGLDLADWRILRDFLILRVDSVKLGSAVFHSAQSNAFSCSKMLYTISGAVSQVAFSFIWVNKRQIGQRGQEKSLLVRKLL